MSKIIVAAVICSLCVAIQAASLPVNDATTMFVSDLTTYLRENPELEVIGELERSGSNRIPIRYTLGKRVAGDRLAAELTEKNQWSQPQDVTFTLTYPKSGLGAVITYVQIDVNQSTNVGRGVVVAGGLGQRSIKVVVEAKGTTYFEHHSQIFGGN